MRMQRTINLMAPLRNGSRGRRSERLFFALAEGTSFAIDFHLSRFPFSAEKPYCVCILWVFEMPAAAQKKRKESGEDEGPDALILKIIQSLYLYQLMADGCAGSSFFHFLCRRAAYLFTI